VFLSVSDTGTRRGSFAGDPKLVSRTPKGIKQILANDLPGVGLVRGATHPSLRNAECARLPPLGDHRQELRHLARPSIGRTQIFVHDWSESADELVDRDLDEHGHLDDVASDCGSEQV
jgi:hypothetical protein